MKRRLFGLAALWLVTGVTIGAADFWETKSFVTWSDKELEKIVSDVDDGEVELVSTSGPIEIRKKFTLKDMVFHGRLEM